MKTDDDAGLTASRDGDDLQVGGEHTERPLHLDVTDGTIRATDVGKLTTTDGRSLVLYDPALLNTATCRSTITYLDGENGVLRYRGYPIEELAAGADYLETAYLLVHGELPDAGQYTRWSQDIFAESRADDTLIELAASLGSDVPPMTMLLTLVATLGARFPEASDVDDPAVRSRQITRLIAQAPTLAALCHRRAAGLPPDSPAGGRGYVADFLNRLFATDAAGYDPDPRLVRALEILFVLHADHEQNCSTNAVRAVGSAKADPYVSVAAGVAALSGPLHGGANEAVIRMLHRVGTVDRAAAFVDGVKAGRERLMGFGHRVYKNYDPRARIIKSAADDVFAVTGTNPLLDVALELERIALEDEYFISRKLYPNVDFYSGLVYEALGLPAAMFPVLFAVPRMSGWLAQWDESRADPEQKITRPKQVYTGPALRAHRPH